MNFYGYNKIFLFPVQFPLKYAKVMHYYTKHNYFVNKTFITITMSGVSKVISFTRSLFIPVNVGG